MFEIMIPLGSTQQKRCQKISQAKDKRKGRSCQHSGNGKRKNDLPKSLQRRSTKVVRRLHQISRDVFQRRINRQERERGVDVSERQHHGERAVQKKFQWMLGQVYVLQKRVEDAIAPQDGFPGVSADQVTHPEWNDYELIE